MTLDGLPLSNTLPRYWAQEVRLPLRGLTSLAELRLVPRGGSGSAWLIDAWGWRPGLPAARPAALPRVDAGNLTVGEGDGGRHTIHLPVRVSGPGAGRVRMFLDDVSTGRSRSWIAAVRPGHTTIPVPVTVVGDRLRGADRKFRLRVKAVHGVQVGRWLGRSQVRDDDPAPRCTVGPVEEAVPLTGGAAWRRCPRPSRR